LTFPAIDPIPTPTGSATYSYSSKNSATLPAGNWKNINVSSGQLTIPGGTYGALNVTSQGTIVLGTPGQTTTYNFQSFSTGAQSSIVFAGSVVINIEGGVDVGAGGSISNLSMAASAIHWNLKGTGQTQLSIGGNGNTLGVFYAPNNLLYMRGGGNFYGAIIGQSVNVGGNASIHIDQDAVLPVTTTKKVVITANITVGYTATDYSLWRITQQID
jgi:hypothetical protein